jgi:type IV pilus assembly protein PilA
MLRLRKGFTLIELLIVVVIIGILAAIAIPKFGNTREKAYLSAMRADLRNLATAQEEYFADHQQYYFGSITMGQSDQEGVFTFMPSTGVLSIELDGAGAQWSAKATHSQLLDGPYCGVGHNGQTNPVDGSAPDGEIKCQ